MGSLGAEVFLLVEIRICGWGFGSRLDGVLGFKVRGRGFGPVECVLPALTVERVRVCNVRVF